VLDVPSASGKHVACADSGRAADQDSAMRVTKAPTEGSAAWQKSFSHGSEAQRVSESPEREGIVDVRRLRTLGLGQLAERVGQQLQVRLHNEVSKYEKPVKLKVMTGRDVRKMKNQFSIFFEEPKTKAQALGHPH
jgi:hypothetical protein